MNRLKELRAKYGLTTRKLGSYIGISNTAITYIEKGRSSPNAKIVSELARYFNVTTDYFLGEADYGIWVKYRYKNKTQDCQVSEDRVALAKEEGCLVEIIADDYIHREIVGKEAEMYFNDVHNFKTLKFETLAMAFNQLSDESQELIINFINMIIEKEKAKDKEMK